MVWMSLDDWLNFEPKYSFSEKTKSLMGFVYRVLWILKALWIVLSETVNILRNLQKTKYFRAPKNFTIGVYVHTSL